MELLIVIVSNNQNGLENDAGIALKGDQFINTLVVHPTQIALVNNKLSNSEQILDVLIIGEDQVEGFDHLDRIREILHFCEKHGAAVLLNEFSLGINRFTRKQYDEVTKYLGEYRVIPYIESIPVLIKAEVFERFGLLDENFQNIMGALKDFSIRFNQYGWSTVRVNCWSDSTDNMRRLCEADRNIIQRRYPYIHEIEEIYYRYAERASEHFANVLVQEEGQKPSLLFSLYEVPPSFNGTANYALKLLAAFWDKCNEKYEISILARENTDEFHKLSEKYPRVYYPEAVKRHTFRLGFIVSQVLCAEHMDIINKCCLKYSLCMLDIICLRSHYLCKNDPGRFELFRDSIKYADLMLSISQFSHDDIIGFFHDDMQDTTVRTGILYLGTDKETPAAAIEETEGPFKAGDYYIVIGNAYKHKMIEPVLEILKDIEENFIVIGTKTEGYYQKSKKIYGFVSGWLDHSRLNKMIAASKCIIFPSVYEGFGLTLYDAAVYRKKIIVSDTQVNLELKQLLGEYGGDIITYRRLEELKIILSGNDFENSWSGESANIRNWQDVAKELDEWMESVQDEETDILRLESRWKYLRRYQNEHNCSAEKKSSLNRERLIRKCITNFPKTYQLYRKVVTAIDKEHYGSH